jgi:chromosome partitioning protein
MPVVALANQKGGVGKTTIALGLAALAAERGLDTVVVDVDPQANATAGLAVWSPPADVAAALRRDEAGAVADVLVASGWDPPHDGIRVAASTPALAALEPELAADPVGAQDRLRLALRGLEADLVLIDCPPALGLLSINALFAADAVLVVTEPAGWASDGVARVRTTIDRIAARRGGAPALAGIVVNRVARTRDAAYWHDVLVEDHGDLVLAPVHQRAAVAEAAARSVPLPSLGRRAGTEEAVAEMSAVLDAVLARVPAEPVAVPRA